MPKSHRWSKGQGPRVTLPQRGTSFADPTKPVAEKQKCDLCSSTQGVRAMGGGLLMCLGCRRTQPMPDHGLYRYTLGCRCEVCRQANRDAIARHHEKAAR